VTIKQLLLESAEYWRPLLKRAAKETAVLKEDTVDCYITPQKEGMYKL
jgi:hypothetical protein